MTETWVMEDGAATAVSSGTVVAALRARVASGRLETWLTGSSGRMLAFVTNTERATVVLLDGAGDPGEHAVDPEADAEEWSDGFVLANGQDDSYPDRDTVPVEEALGLVAHLVDTGAWPPAARWVADR